jgi:hypothetical protein
VAAASAEPVRYHVRPEWDGVLTRVTRAENRLALTIECEGREAVGRLEWDPPPSLTAVEKVLRAHLGEPITAIGYLDVR